MARAPSGARLRAAGGIRVTASGSSGQAVRKGTWMAEEDAVLLEHVRVHGPSNWSSIRSKGLLPRTGKSCRLRWVNKLRPNLKSGCKFSAEEERVVLDLQAKFGNKWARIATYLPGRTDNDVKNFWSTRQKRLAKLRRSPRPGGGRSGKNLSAKKAAASSQASEFAGRFSLDQISCERSSSSSQCRAATPLMDAQNAALVRYDQTDFQHLGSGEAFMPALSAPDIKACSSNKAPLLGRTGNAFDNFWSTSQKQSGRNCSAKTVAASSLQPPLVEGSFKDQFPFASSSSGGQCRAGTTFLDAQNSELVPNDQTDFQHLGSGEAFMPALPAPDIKACSSNKAPLLGRTGNDFDSFRSTSQKQSGWNCSAKTVAASSLQPPLVEGSFLDQFPFASSSSGGQYRAGTAFMDAQNSELVPYDQAGSQLFGFGGAQPPVALATNIQAGSSNAASLWPPQLQMYQPSYPLLDFSSIPGSGDMTPGFLSAGAVYDFTYHQELLPYMQPSQAPFQFFGMHDGVKIEPRDPPHHFDDLPLDIFDSADQLPPTSSPSRTISDH